MQSSTTQVNFTLSENPEETAAAQAARLLWAQISSGADSDFSSLLAAAAEHGISPQLAVTHPNAPEAKALRREITLLHALHIAVLGPIAARCAAEGIPLLVFKGAALAVSHYPDSGMRLRVDSDIWVPLAARTAVSQILINLGGTPGLANVSVLTHPEQCFSFDSAGTTVQIDLHWASNSKLCLAHATPFAQVWQEAVAFPGLSGARMPNPAWALLLAAAHRVGHHRDTMRLVWLLDMQLLWGAMTSADQAHVVALAQRHRLCGVLLHCLLETQAYIPLALNDGVREQLAHSARNEPATDLLQYRGPGWRINLRHATWPERWLIIKEKLLADQSYLHARFGPHPRWQSPWYQTKRWLQRGRTAPDTIKAMRQESDPGSASESSSLR